MLFSTLEAKVNVKSENINK